MAITHTSQGTSKRVVDWACIIGFRSRINRSAVLYRMFALLRWNWSRYFHCLTSVAVSVFGSVLISVSFGTVVSVRIERYIALCLHLGYGDVVKVKRARNFLITLWLIGGTLPFIWVWLTPKYRSHFFSTGILLCLVISSVAYIKIYRIIRYHRRQIISTEMNARKHKKMAQRKRNTFNMFVVHCVLVLCYLPYSICLLVVKSYGYTNCSWIGINFALTVVNINSSVNPFIYCYRMRQIRRARIMTLQNSAAGFKTLKGFWHFLFILRFLTLTKCTFMHLFQLEFTTCR